MFATTPDAFFIFKVFASRVDIYLTEKKKRIRENDLREFIFCLKITFRSSIAHMLMPIQAIYMRA